MSKMKVHVHAVGWLLKDIFYTVFLLCQGLELQSDTAGHGPLRWNLHNVQHQHLWSKTLSNTHEHAQKCERYGRVKSS